MKKGIFLLLALVPFLFISCDRQTDVNDSKINREQFVGDYLLSESGHLDVIIDGKTQPNGIDLNGKINFFL